MSTRPQHWIIAAAMCGDVAAHAPVVHRTPTRQPTAAAQPRPSAPPGSVTVLGVSGSQFTLDGEPRFLLFVSYFDALRRVCPQAAGNCRGMEGDIDTDLEYFKAHGFDGIRIFPNWFHYASGKKADDDALFTGTGSAVEAPGVRSDKWEVLLEVIERAAAHGLLVDVTFTSETVTSLSRERYRSQLGEVTKRLTGRYPNVLFDLSNEFPRWTTRDEIRRILTQQVRPFDTRRIVTASLDSGTVESLKAGQDSAFIGGSDPRFIPAYHEGRGAAEWFQDAAIGGMLEQIRRGLGAARPIYLQEPMPFSRFCDGCPGVFDATPGHARAAARAAKQHGAAAWTFHTRKTFDLAARRYTEIVPEGSPERTELEAIRPGLEK